MNTVEIHTASGSATLFEKTVITVNGVTIHGASVKEISPRAITLSFPLSDLRSTNTETDS